MGEIRQLAHLVAEDEPEIPQRIEKAADEPLLLCADRAVEEHQDVDVRVKAEMPTSVSAEREDRDAARGPRRRLEELLQQRVDAVGVALDSAPPARAATRVLYQLPARRLEQTDRR